MNIRIPVQTGIAFLIFLTLLVFSPSAFAHSELEKTNPSGQASLEAPPKTIEAWYNQPVDVYSGSITVTSQSGKPLETGAISADPTNDRHIVAPVTGSASPGTYTVQIRVLSKDGHLLNDTFQFEINLPAEKKEPAPKQYKLLKSAPADGTIVSTSPKQLDLWFSEPVDIFAVGVFDLGQKDYGSTQFIQDPSDPTHYQVPFQEELKPGTYNVTWLVNTDKGEIMQGAFYFAVNQLSSPASVPDSDISGNDTASWKAVPQWLSYASAFLLFGGAFFVFFLSEGQGNRRRLDVILLGAYGVLFVSLAAQFLLQVFELPDATIQDLLKLKIGWVTLLQVLVLFTAFFLRHQKSSVILLGVLISLYSFAGHSVSLNFGGWGSVLLNTLHLLSLAVWLGGLTALLLMFPGQDQMSWLKRQGKRFSLWAACCLVLATLTGVGLTVNYTSTLSGFLNSAWGKSVLAKAALTVLIGLIGYLQFRFVKSGSLSMLGYFIRKGRVEIGLGIVVLLLASFLVDFSPTAAEREVTPNTVMKNGMTAAIGVSPLTIGYNDIDVYLKGPTDIRDVKVRFKMPPDMDVQYTAFRIGDGHYRVVGNQLHAPGTTEVEVEANTGTGEKLLFPFKVKLPGMVDTPIE